MSEREPTGLVEEEASDPREERKRRGCRNLLLFVAAFLLVLILAGIGAWLYSGTDSFERYVARKIEANLESKLGRNVEIGDVEISRGTIARVILTDVRVANVDGSSQPWFAIVPQVVIEGGIESFRSRTIQVGTIYVDRPTVFIEIFPEGSALTHNIPSWKRSAPRSYEITRLELDEVAIDEGALLFQDRRRDMTFDLRGIDGRIKPDIRQGRTNGVAVVKELTAAIPGLAPLEAKFTTGFELADGVLSIRRFRAEGDGLEATAEGELRNFSELEYELALEIEAEMEAVRRLTGADAALDGVARFDGRLVGSRDTYELKGPLTSGRISANAYTIEDLVSELTIVPDRASLNIERASYADGTVSGVWQMDSFSDPRPMSVALDLERVVLESVLADWNLGESGLRGRTSGRIEYRWAGPDLLAGSGTGDLVIERGSVAFSSAPYPLAVSGRSVFDLDAGVVRFRGTELRTASSEIDISGSLRLEDLVADLELVVDSSDFSELDRLGVNFARATGNEEFELLGLGGDGTLVASVSGPFSTADVDLKIEGTGLRYGSSPIGSGMLMLAWDGGGQTLEFREATLRRNDGTLSLAGAIGLGEGGPRFDLRVDVEGWSVEDALGVVDLDFPVTGLGTGTLQVTGTGDAGMVELSGLRIEEGDAVVVANGTVSWMPGDVTGFDLTLDAENYDVARAVEVVGLELEVRGLGTGRLVVSGTSARGDVAFEDFVVRDGASRLALQGTAGWLEGSEDAELDLSLGAESVPLATVIDFLELGELPLEGDLSGSLTLEGSRSDLRGAGSIILRNGVVAGEPIELLTADLLFVDQRVDVKALHVEAPAGTLDGEASWHLENETFTYVIEPTVLDLSEIVSLGDLTTIIDGDLELTSSGAGTLEDPEFVFDAVLRNPVIQGVALREGTEPLDVYAAVRRGKIVVDASGFGVFSIEGEGAILENGELDGAFDLTVGDAGKLVELLSPGSQIPIEGSFAARLQLGGLATTEGVEIDAGLTELSVLVSGEEVTTTRPVDLRLRNGALVFDAVEFRTAETNFLLDGSVPVFSEEPMSLQMRGTIEAAMAQLFVPGLRASGTLVVRAEARGSPASPRLSGTVEIRDASARFDTLPQTISEIVGTILFRGNRIEIDSLTARLGGGAIVVGGAVTHESFVPSRIQLSARGTDVTIRYFEGVTVAGDFDLTLSGNPERMVVRGSYNVDQAVYYKDLDLASTIVDRLVARQAVTPRVTAGWQDDVALAIDVTADETLRVENNVADLRGSAALEVVGTLANPVILGQVTLDEGGEVTFQDVEYEIVQGTISFQNPFRNDPYFDITAEGLMKARGQDLGEVEEYELTVSLTGTLDQITPNITSEPPLGDVTLLTLLAGEIGGNGQPGFGGTQTLTGAGTELLLSSVGEAIGSRILPFADAVRLESVGSDGSFSPTVTLEKEISEDIFVIVIYDTASTQNIEIVQWQASRDWVVQFTRDSEKEDNGWVINAIDARFRRRYEGRW